MSSFDRSCESIVCVRVACVQYGLVVCGFLCLWFGLIFCFRLCVGLWLRLVLSWRVLFCFLCEVAVFCLVFFLPR